MVIAMASRPHKLKYYVKKALVWLGLYHPALGIKISPQNKSLILLEYKTFFEIFVETGTHEGDMVERMKNYFRKIYSIELDEKLYQKAKDRFKEDYIEIIHGDSAVELKKLLSKIHKPILFWLDAHWGGAITSGNSPIKKELEAIFGHSIKKHVILIDDARHFDLPTIREIKKLAKLNNYSFEIEYGLFRLYPKK